MDMLTNTRNRLPLKWPVSGVALTLALTLGAFARQAPPSADMPARLPAAATPQSEHDALSDDTRLNLKVTMLRRRATVGDVLAELTKQTQVKLDAPDAELSHVLLAVAVKDASLRDMLRAMAALNGWQWRRGLDAKKKPVLTLHEADDPHRWDFLRPRTQADADAHKGVQDFLKQISDLPPDAQQALVAGVPFASLPAGAQQAAQQAVRAQIQVLIQRFHITPRITPDNLDGFKVRFYSRTGEDSTGYTLDVYANNVGNVMCVTTIPNDPVARDVENTINASTGAVPYQEVQEKAVADSYAASRKKAISQVPAFKGRVSLTMDAEAPLGFALAALAPPPPVSVVAQPSRERHALSLASVPLGEALDRIAAKYRCIWGVSKQGVVLFHSLPTPSPGDSSPEEAEAARVGHQAMLQKFFGGPRR